MTLTRTTLATYGAAINTAGGWTSGSFTPADGSLLVACVSGMHDWGSTDPSADFTISDSAGLTWTRGVYYGDASSWSMGGAIFTAPVTTGVSMTVSADCAARAMYSGSIVVLGFTGHDTSSPIGATGTVTGPTNGAATITLSGTPASTSQVVGQLVIDLAGAPDTVVGADYAEIVELDMSGSAAEVMVRTANVASTSFGWDDVDGGSASIYKSAGMAVEVREASVTAPAFVAPRRPRVALLGIRT